MAGEVRLTCTLNKETILATPTEQAAYLLIKIMPEASQIPAKMPLNLGFVLDHSGSMSGAKLQNVKDAVKLALGLMEPNDIVSVVIFDDKAQVLASSQAASNRSGIDRQVNGMTADGGTEMSKGMKLGLAEIQKHATPDRVSRMLLLTDGQTGGDEATCKKLALDAAQGGVPISALGVGSDWNETLLEEIAKASPDGHSEYLATPDAIRQEFSGTVQQMQATVVKNAELTLRLVSGVKARKVWQVVPIIKELPSRAISERDVQATLGELDKNQGQALLVEMTVPVRQPGRYRIAQVEVSYDVPALKLQAEKARADILLAYSANPAETQSYSAEVVNLAEKVSVYRMQTRALEEAKQGQTQRLRQVATRLLELGEADLAKAATEEADRVDKNQGLSAAGTKKLQYGTRKLTQILPPEPPER